MNAVISNDQTGHDIIDSEIVDSEIVTAQPVRLSKLVARITAPNPSIMTGPGTNTYLVGNDDITVIDPGPLIDSHVQNIVNIAGNKLKRVICTHTHPDHSPAATPLARLAKVPLIGTTIADDGHQDLTFKPDLQLSHNQVIVTDEYSIEAIHTPGHVGNHYCLLLREHNLLFAGDHLMAGSTVVIVPPYGDMGDYIKSLELLKHYPIEVIAPAHGKLIPNATTILDDTIVHRLKREAKVVKAMEKNLDATVDQLIPHVYSDVNQNLYFLARWSLLAHLLKLKSDGRARDFNEQQKPVMESEYLNGFKNEAVFTAHRWRLLDP